jgi:hypothetical protein
MILHSKTKIHFTHNSYCIRTCYTSYIVWVSYLTKYYILPAASEHCCPPQMLNARHIHPWIDQYGFQFWRPVLHMLHGIPDSCISITLVRPVAYKLQSITPKCNDSNPYLKSTHIIPCKSRLVCTRNNMNCFVWLRRSIHIHLFELNCRKAHCISVEDVRRLT